jgi:RNA polymerase sigma-70 factor (ECF subfamily)
MNEEERHEQIQLAVGGDADALQRLLIEYHVPLRRAVEEQIDGTFRRYVDPDDVLQDAYAAVFKAFASCTFDGPAAFYGWVEQITYNQLKNRCRALRTQKRDVTRETRGSVAASSTYPELVQRLACSDISPSRKVARSEATAAVLSSLARLSDDQRNVIRLRFLEGRAVADVAATLGKSEAAVHGLCRRGLLTLRASLASASKYLTR